MYKHFSRLIVLTAAASLFSVAVLADSVKEIQAAQVEDCNHILRIETVYKELQMRTPNSEKVDEWLSMELEQRQRFKELGCDKTVMAKG